MTYHQTVNKRSYLGAAIALACVQTIAQSFSAVAQSPYPAAPSSENLLCYFETSSGTTLNLERLCGPQSPVPNPLSATDQKFLEEYQGFLRGYPNQVTLARLANQNPQAIVDKANKLCNALRVGRPEFNNGGRPEPDADILSSLAPQYYCPEYDD